MVSFTSAFFCRRGGAVLEGGWVGRCGGSCHAVLSEHRVMGGSWVPLGSFLLPEFLELAEMVLHPGAGS